MPLLNTPPTLALPSKNTAVFDAVTFKIVSLPASAFIPLSTVMITSSKLVLPSLINPFLIYIAFFLKAKSNSIIYYINI